MALTLQKTLELAGALSKVQPQLQRLHIVEKPKGRHLRRNAVLVGSAIAAGVVLAAVVCRQRGWCTHATAGAGEEVQVRSSEQTPPDAALDREGLATDVDAFQDIATPKAA
jgi:hypothetical protein